ncbi:lonely Cys domain-containing protein [Streptomyces sp. FXJ1.4098]|nr:lonely Cys domain-containing protein [Streptomyces sp. FXJ1.4098]
MLHKLHAGGPGRGRPGGLPGRPRICGGIAVPMWDGSTRMLDGPGTQRWARARRNSMSVIPADYWADLEICWAGSPRNTRIPLGDNAGTGFPGPFVADPLENVPVGQYYANGLRRKVRCTVRIAGLTEAGPRNRRVYLRAMLTDPQGRRSERAKFFPEPRAAELKRRARAIGFGGPDGRVSGPQRHRTLRLVRALKLALGNEVDDAVRVKKDPEYARLLRGAAALDRMWHADGRFDASGPFTMELFHRIVAAKLPAGQTEPRRADYRAVLLEAANAADGTRLSDFVTLSPAVDAASSWKGALSAAAWDGVVGPMLGVGAADVEDGHRSRAFWAQVKAHELLYRPGLDVDGLARKALHLEATDPVDAARREELWRLVAKAYARGRDAADFHVLAAFHLEAAEPFSWACRLKDPLLNGENAGNDWSTGTRIARLDTSRIQTPDGLEDAPWTGQDDAGHERAVPFVVRASYDPSDPDALRLRFRGNKPVFRVPFEEFVELMAYHPKLVDRRLNGVLVLDIPGLYDTRLADMLTERLGRPTTVTSGTTGSPAPAGRSTRSCPCPPHRWRRSRRRRAGSSGNRSNPPPPRTPRSRCHPCSTARPCPVARPWAPAAPRPARPRRSTTPRPSSRNRASTTGGRCAPRSSASCSPKGSPSRTRGPRCGWTRARSRPTPGAR